MLSLCSGIAGIIAQVHKWAAVKRDSSARFSSQFVSLFHSRFLYMALI